MLTDALLKIKAWLKGNQRDLWLSLLVFLVSVGSFGLGRLSAVWPEEEPVVIENRESGIMNPGKGNGNAAVVQSHESNPIILDPAPQGAFVASRNGSSYHLPDCPGAKQIKSENRIWFPTKAEAQAAGYKPAGNCPGL